MVQNQLTPEQVQQLVDAAAKDPLQSHFALKDGPRYTESQQQQLVDSIAKNSQVATWTLTEVPWATTEQKGQLRVVGMAA